jgi:azurin
MDSTRRSIALGLSTVPLAAAFAWSHEQQTVELHVSTDGDELAFKPRRLSCPTGVLVRLFFHHTGEILDDKHDWVLLRPGMEKAFLADADKEPDASVTVPPGDAYMVLSATPLCGRGHTVLIEFMAPSPGAYPFVCSVPGHGETMHGTLTVTDG